MLHLAAITIATFLALPIVNSLPHTSHSPFHCSLHESGANCTQVFYKASMLVLSCPGGPGNTQVEWIHTLRKQNYSMNCSDSLNSTQCIVRGYEGRLSNDDSGMYYCSYNNGANFLKAIVTILAPPKIINVMNVPNQCTPRVERSNCKTDHLSYMPGDTFNITVLYYSVAPVTITWFHNDTVMHCPTKDSGVRDNCQSTYSEPGRSEITIHAPVAGYSVSGHYRVSISNDYGSNSTVTEVYFECRLPDKPMPVSNKDVYYNITAGEVMDLSDVCQVGLAPNFHQIVCYSNLPNATFENVLANYNSCAVCLGTDDWSPTDKDCSFQLSNTDRFVVSGGIGLCRGVVTINLRSRENRKVTHADSGKFFCSYQMETKEILYTTVHINVVDKPPPSPPNLLMIKIFVPVGFVLMVLIVVLIVVLGYKHRVKQRASLERHRRPRRKRSSLHINGKGTRDKRSVSAWPKTSHRNYGTINSPDSSDNENTTSAAEKGDLTEVQSDWPHGDLSTQGKAIV